MTSPVLPSVRSLIVCEDIITPAGNPRRVTLVNLVNSIRSIEGPPYPLRQPQLCIFVQLVECRGPGSVRVKIREADRERESPLFATRSRNVSFPSNPLIVHGLRFRIYNCRFPRPGLYWVQFYFDDRILGQTPLVLC